MNLITLFQKIAPYVKPYRWLVVLTLILTIIGSFIEQSGNPDMLYREGGVYKDIVDASVRSLNIDKLAQTLDTDGNGVLFD